MQPELTRLVLSAADAANQLEPMEELSAVYRSLGRAKKGTRNAARRTKRRVARALELPSKRRLREKQELEREHGGQFGLGWTMSFVLTT